MADKWKGGAGDWGTASNWNNGVPSDDDVTIAAKSTTINGEHFKEKTLTENNGASVVVENNSQLTLTGPGDDNLNGGSTLDAESGGKITIKGNLDSNSTGHIIVGSGSSVFVVGDDNVGGINFNINGGTLSFDGNVGQFDAVDDVITASPVIKFNGPGGVLDLTQETDETSQFFGKVSGFQTGDEINVAAGGRNDTLATIVGATSTIVEVFNGSDLVADVEFVGKPAGNFELKTPGAGNPFNIDTIYLSDELGCFLAGTMVSTPSGEVAVETLKHGDIVLSSDGREVPVIWVGKQTVSTRFADPMRVLPIRIKAGAFDENIPARDLLVSTDHAMLVQGALIHAGALVNGTSIVRETRVPETFVYYHVEAEDHSIILAENAPAETFIDNIDRLGFDNWAEHQALYPEGRTVEELPYPRAKSARQIPVHVRVKLAERAQAIGADVPAVA